MDEVRRITSYVAESTTNHDRVPHHGNHSKSVSNPQLRRTNVSTLNGVSGSVGVVGSGGGGAVTAAEEARKSLSLSSPTLGGAKSVSSNRNSTTLEHSSSEGSDITTKCTPTDESLRLRRRYSERELPQVGSSDCTVSDRNSRKHHESNQQQQQQQQSPRRQELPALDLRLASAKPSSESPPRAKHLSCHTPPPEISIRGLVTTQEISQPTHSAPHPKTDNSANASREARLRSHSCPRPSSHKPSLPQEEPVSPPLRSASDVLSFNPVHEHHLRSASVCGTEIESRQPRPHYENPHKQLNERKDFVPPQRSLTVGSEHPETAIASGHQSRRCYGPYPSQSPSLAPQMLPPQKQSLPPLSSRKTPQIEQQNSFASEYNRHHKGHEAVERNEPQDPSSAEGKDNTSSISLSFQDQKRLQQELEVHVKLALQEEQKKIAKQKAKEQERLSNQLSAMASRLQIVEEKISSQDATIELLKRRLSGELHPPTYPTHHRSRSWGDMKSPDVLAHQSHQPTVKPEPTPVPPQSTTPLQQTVTPPPPSTTPLQQTVVQAKPEDAPHGFFKKSFLSKKLFNKQAPPSKSPAISSDKSCTTTSASNPTSSANSTSSSNGYVKSAMADVLFSGLLGGVGVKDSKYWEHRDEAPPPAKPEPELDILDVAPAISSTGDYGEIKLIGEGSAGKIFSALQKSSKKKVAIKVIPLADRNKKQLINEILVMKSSHHPNLISFIDCFTKGDQIRIVMEYMDGGTLTDVLDNHHPLSTHVIGYVCYSVLKALEYLHSNNKIHRDIKSDNTLLGRDGTCKIGDFGYASSLSNPHSLRHSIVGTPYWMAPEVVKTKEYNSKACTAIFS
ncbi:Serine/threonine-protein kinase PAK 2 [Pelomyxa schiedti]|nr:Serine/threonine-protein kinase PAK 2 [Pelomyxa schiedti]